MAETLYTRVEASGGGLPDEICHGYFVQMAVVARSRHHSGIAPCGVTLKDINIQCALTPSITMIKAAEWSGRLTGTTPAYIPEALRGTSMQADIYNMGLMLYAMLTGIMPTGEQPYMDIVAGRVAPDCIELLSGMLSTDPNMRPTAAVVLNHPWTMRNIPSRPPPPPMSRAVANFLANQPMRTETI